ncbi:L-lactate dehydrogenase [Aliidiomarina haloalkalitolerans]|uniref:Alpha-hydroxy-acid oxidizing enzyme n=1 Tax=Aliidiomarina haloalkalitolerans TaxID=859059 RepID=A0A432VW33_9GAMM|nr:L-lactate dehydrogenase [Aliidiomarina haloalkalitolerans]RUO20704.1 alpha-hydroxy-acid oxidizing enzyme [Aliidiomarina haloalkalitolerans]
MARFIAPASIEDYRTLAQQRLPRQFFDYLEGGAYAEQTCRENITAFSQIHLRQRVLKDVSERDLSATLLGQPFALPVVLGPVGLAGLNARRGEVQAARAAKAAGVAFCESTVSLCSIEEVAATDAQLWFQLYMLKDRGYAIELLQRAQRAGVDVLVFTVDLAVLGARYRDVRNGIAGSSGLRAKLSKVVDLLSHPQWLWDAPIKGKPLVFGNLAAAVPNAKSLPAFKQWVDDQFDPSVTWDDLNWLREHWQGKIVLKGILDPEDASIAASIGFDAIAVSNHGGRQLDNVEASIHALPRCVDAVAGRCEVLVDGGIRSGLDIVKALALGANGCMLGRAWAYGLAAKGEQGVSEVLAILRAEMDVAMALTGCRSIAEITPDILLRR